MKIKRIISFTLTLTMLLTATVFIASAKTTINNDKDMLAETSSLQAYNLYLEKEMTSAGLSGVAYVTQNGIVIAQHASGMQNTNESIPMTTDSLFAIGSVSKQFCATAILILQEQGKLSVHDTLSKYFPEYEIGKNITIHHLLSMRSGIRDHVNIDEEFVGTESPFTQYQLSETATYKENQKTITDWLFNENLKFTPGEQFAYSNSNFLLLSIIVEQVSGVKYTEFVKENIFNPLGMTNSGTYEELYTHPDLAEYILPDGYVPAEPYFHGMSYGCGDIVSNGPDIDKWLTSISHRTLLSDESYDAMLTNYGDNYGYGIFTDAKNGTFYHQGDIASYQTFAMTLPEKNINIFVVTNDVNTMTNNGFGMNQFGYNILNKVNTKTVLGDVDSDKQVSILDATALQMHFAQIKTLSTKQLRSGDTDGDGKVSIMDATEIQLHLAQK